MLAQIYNRKEESKKQEAIESCKSFIKNIPCYQYYYDREEEHQQYSPIGYNGTFYNNFLSSKSKYKNFGEEIKATIMEEFQELQDKKNYVDASYLLLYTIGKEMPSLMISTADKAYNFLINKNYSEINPNSNEVYNYDPFKASMLSFKVGLPISKTINALVLGIEDGRITPKSLLNKYNSNYIFNNYFFDVLKKSETDEISLLFNSLMKKGNYLEATKMAEFLINFELSKHINSIKEAVRTDVFNTSEFNNNLKDSPYMKSKELRLYRKLELQAVEKHIENLCNYNLYDQAEVFAKPYYNNKLLTKIYSSEFKYFVSNEDYENAIEIAIRKNLPEFTKIKDYLKKINDNK
jgi:hypothetical protein